MLRVRLWHQGCSWLCLLISADVPEHIGQDLHNQLELCVLGAAALDRGYLADMGSRLEADPLMIYSLSEVNTVTLESH